MTDPMVIGWKEMVSFPEWGIKNLLAKSDTGARGSAIDVKNIVELPGDRVRFEVVLHRRDRDFVQTIETDIVRHTRVRSSNGVVQERYKVATILEVGEVRKRVELSIVNRKTMLCRVLLGREALADDFLVDASNKYLFGARLKPRKKKSAPEAVAGPSGGAGKSKKKKRKKLKKKRPAELAAATGAAEAAVPKSKAPSPSPSPSSTTPTPTSPHRP